jgi:hypothetical protein
MEEKRRNLRQNEILVKQKIKWLNAMLNFNLKVQRLETGRKRYTAVFEAVLLEN